MHVGRETNRIFLVGFMGSGKSTVGECLAREIGFRFVDLDREIERDAGRSIETIFTQEGESGFRRLEAQVLRRAGVLPRAVVATGGGTLTRWENREFLLHHGWIVWLDAPLDVMLGRCRDGERRPLLGTPEAMARLHAERVAGYRIADVRFDSDGQIPEEIARRIAAWLPERA